MTREEIIHIYNRKMWLTSSGYPRFPQSAIYAYKVGIIREDEKAKYGIDKIQRRNNL